MIKVSDKQLDIVKHTWGYDHVRSPGFRNRYCTHLDNADVLSLVKDGLMAGPVAVMLTGTGYGMFYLTDLGLEFIFNLKKSDLEKELLTNGKTRKWLTRRINLIKKAMQE